MVGGFLQINRFSPSTRNKPKPQGRFLKITQYEVDKLKNLLNNEFEMKDLGSAKRILGIEILKDRVAGTLFLS